MNHIVSLPQFRAKKKKAWLELNKYQFHGFLCDFISFHMGSNFLQVSEAFQTEQRNQEEESWDYLELRSLIHEAMEASFCIKLYTELTKQPWFDRKLLSQEEAVEHCLSLYILDSINFVSADK